MRSDVVYVVPGGMGGVNSFYNNLNGLLEGRFFYTKNTYFISRNSLVMLIRFLGFMTKYRPKVIVVNPSLFKRAIIRDYTFGIIAEKYFGCEVIVFWRGWNPNNEYLLDSYPRISKYLFRKTNLCLNSYVFDKLVSYEVSVVRVSTSYDNLIERKEVKRRTTFNIEHILFLGRLEQEKGVYELLEFLDKSEEKIFLSVAGDGSLRQLVQSHPKVNYLGYLLGDDKINAFLSHSLFVLPSYSEGMPNAILEAMRMGLIVIATKVGALTDIIDNGKNGFLIEPKSVDSLLDCLKHIRSLDAGLLRDISLNAMHTAKQFSPNIVANQINKLTGIC